MPLFFTEFLSSTPKMPKANQLPSFAINSETLFMINLVLSKWAIQSINIKKTEQKASCPINNPAASCRGMHLIFLVSVRCKHRGIKPLRPFDKLRVNSANDFEIKIKVSLINAELIQKKNQCRLVNRKKYSVVK